MASNLLRTLASARCLIPLSPVSVLPRAAPRNLDYRTFVTTFLPNIDCSAFAVEFGLQVP